jgi:amino acid adenylation domain-containing protein
MERDPVTQSEVTSDVTSDGTSGVRNLAELLEASARLHPDSTAVVAPDLTQLSYRDLNDRADRIAALLVERGIKPGDRVGLCMPKGAASVALLFGVMKARAAYVPVDWQGPAARNRSILADCGVAALFLDEGRADVAKEFGAAAPPLLRFAEAVAHAPLDADAAAALAAARQPTDLAYILYTSGSTGVPKGVMVTHGNALAFVDWCSATFTPTAADRFSSHAPFHFDLSVLDLYVALKHGATLCLIGEELGKDPKSLAKWIAQQRITLWYSTPSVLALLTEFGNLDRIDLTALRIVNFAGEVFPVAPLRRLTRLIPHANYFNLYGPTETNVCTFAKIPLPVADDRTRAYPIGALCSHCEGRVADAKLNLVRRGQEGLLWIAGPSLFQGYWNRPEVNATLFVEDHGRRWYNTGDVVRDDPRDGLLFVGRRDRMVKRRGHRIELGEIEAALQRHPELREAAVVALDDGEAGVKIRAHVSGKHDAKLSVVDEALVRRRAARLDEPRPLRLPRRAAAHLDRQGRLPGAAPARREAVTPPP